MSARDRVAATAKEYVGTAYHNHARIKGVGVDCLTLLACVYEDAGLIPHIEIPYYSPDFMKHKGNERYLDGLLHYTQEVSMPQPGDIALWKFGRCFSHAAIVIEWPLIVHAHIRSGVIFENVNHAVWLSMQGLQKRPVKFFSYWNQHGISPRASGIEKK